MVREVTLCDKVHGWPQHGCMVPMLVSAGSLKFQEDVLLGEGCSPDKDDIKPIYTVGTNSVHQQVWSFSW